MASSSQNSFATVVLASLICALMSIGQKTHGSPPSQGGSIPPGPAETPAAAASFGRQEALAVAAVLKQGLEKGRAIGLQLRSPS